MDYGEENLCKKMCDILLIGAMGDIGEAVGESLTTHGLRVQLIPFAQNTFRDESGYRRTLRQALTSCAPRMVWPVGHPLALSRLVHASSDDGMSHLSSADAWLRERLREVIVPVSSPEVIMRLDSKVRCSHLAKELAIPQPAFYASAEEVTAYPVIFKRDRSFGGSGVYRPRTAEALRRLMANEAGRPYLIEELVEGYDISVDIVRYDGCFHAACYRILSRRQGQGPASQREACEAPILVDYARRMLDAVNYQGVCGMDFRIGADGRVCFLECNPRFTGGVQAQRESGFDIPWLLYKACLDL